MATQNYFVLTEQERVQAKSLNRPGVEIEPRLIDHATPGNGVNLNDQTKPPMRPGSTVTLAGKYVAPKRIVDDPAHSQAMKDYLLTLPYCLLENETIFQPVPTE